MILGMPIMTARVKKTIRKTLIDVTPPPSSSTPKLSSVTGSGLVGSMIGGVTGCGFMIGSGGGVGFTFGLLFTAGVLLLVSDSVESLTGISL